MKLHQISVFVQNEAGSLAKYLRVLADGGVNIHTLTLADTRDFGILRMIIREWELARELLEKAGAVVKVTEVYAIHVPHRPGGLADVTDLLLEAKVSIEYMYAYNLRKEGSAVMVFCFDQPEPALAALAKVGLTPVEPAILFGSPPSTR